MWLHLTYFGALVTDGGQVLRLMPQLLHLHPAYGLQQLPLSGLGLHHVHGCPELLHAGGQLGLTHQQHTL